MTRSLSRRTVLSGSALAIPVLAAGRAMAGSADGFSYEVTRSEAEWRERLGDEAYRIMREGGTEKQRSSPLWEETASGSYHCRGCDLPLYDGRWKVVLDKGWLFYRQSEPDAMLMSIDQAIPDSAVEATAEERRILDKQAAIEVHCRRCGSHIGHILLVDGEQLHCSNGTAMTFRPTSA